MCMTDSWGEAAVSHKELSLVRSDDLREQGRWGPTREGSLQGAGWMLTHGWVTLFSRSYHNIGKQSYSKKKRNPCYLRTMDLIVIQDDVLWYNINSTKRLFTNKGPWCRVGVVTSDRSRGWAAVSAWDLCPLRFGWRGRGRGDKAVWGGPATREGRKLAAVGYGVFSAVARNLEFFLQVKGDFHGSLHRQAA